MMYRVICLVGLISLISVGVSDAGGKSKDSWEYKLATINKGGYVSEDDITVRRFRYLLKNLSSKTVNTKQQIADMTVKGWTMLREDYGKDIGLLELMEALNKTIPEGGEDVLKYEEVLVAFVMLVGGN